MLALKTRCPCLWGLLVWREADLWVRDQGKVWPGPWWLPRGTAARWVVREGCGEGEVCALGLADEEASAKQK